MKILAIRGENLASLARPFDIRLSEGALADAGLFAITGPTGSGKSTLLDALCLSLFDQTPRYTTGRQGAAVGQKDGDQHLWVKSNDVRQILSRGKGQCFAEVDFVGRDGGAYRARWDLRRARGNAEGRLQAQEMSLSILADGTVISGKKTEVLAAIEEKVGLNWEQFRRAVLLAQGDFAAFLKASPKQRSELLERLTGTEIYSQIGVQAFERGRAAEQQLLTLKAERDGLALMDEAALAALEAEIAGQDQALKQGQALLADHGQVDLLARQQAEQQAQLTEGQQQQQALDGEAEAVTRRQAQIQAYDQAQSGRALYERLSQLEVEWAEVHKRAERLHGEQAQADTALAQSRQALADLVPLRAQHQADWQNWQTQRGRAEQLQIQKDALTEEQGSLARQLAPLRQKLAELAPRIQQQSARQQALQQEQQGLAASLTELRELQGPAAQWSQWREQLGQLAEGMTQSVSLTQQIAQWQPHLAQLRQSRAQAEQGLKAQQADTAQWQQALASWQQQAPEKVDPEQVAHKQQTLVALGQLHDLKQVMSPAEARQQELAAQEEELARALAQWQQQRPELERAAQRLGVQREESQGNLEQARATLALEQHRHLLKAEQPCPLCGSTEHPYVKDQAPQALDAVLGGLQQRLHQLDVELQQHQQALHRGEASAQAWSQQQGQLDQQRQQLAAQLANWQQKCALILAQHPEWAQWSVEDIARQGKAWRAELEQLVESQRRERQWQAELDVRQQGLSEAQARQQQWQERHHKLELECQQTEEQGQQLQHNLASLQERTGKAQQALAEVFPMLPWQSLGGDPRRVHQWGERLDQAITRLKQEQARLQEVEQTLAVLTDGIAKHRAEMQAEQGRLDLLQPKADELTNLVRRLESELVQILGDESLVARHQRLEQAWQQAEASHQGLTEQVAEQEKALAVMARDVEQAQERRQALEGQRRESRQAWGQLLQQLGVDEQQLLQLLSRDHQWREAEQQAISEYHLAREAAKERCETLARALDAKTGQLEQSRQAWQQRLVDSALVSGESTDLAGLNAALSQREDQLFQLRHQRAQQAQQAKRAEDLLAALVQAERDSKHWLQLKAVIGSADGSKFRAMAQSLTLGRLVALANAQLAELAPRYRLQPTPGSGLDLQVIDGDMGEEIRAIESLSGGETFLVSLALALGLSALTSGGSRIGSLFIDEGFGSLDPDSLEMALSCLDALQAAGRQVGVISHVQTLVERIGTRVQLSPAGGGTSQLRVVER